MRSAGSLSCELQRKKSAKAENNTKTHIFSYKLKFIYFCPVAASVLLIKVQLFGIEWLLSRSDVFDRKRRLAEELRQIR